MNINFDFSELTVQQIKSKIRQRRSQMLVHSYIYYELNDNMVSDEQWQKWAEELRFLQETYPQHKKINFFDREFSDWTGDTGAFLPLNNEYVINKSLQVYDSWLKWKEENDK